MLAEYSTEITLQYVSQFSASQADRQEFDAGDNDAIMVLRRCWRGWVQLDVTLTLGSRRWVFHVLMRQMFFAPSRVGYICLVPMVDTRSTQFRRMNH